MTIKQIRQEMGLNQDELANKLNLSRKTIVQVEQGKASPHTCQYAFYYLKNELINRKLKELESLSSLIYSVPSEEV